jgi:hypothetical protein
MHLPGKLKAKIEEFRRLDYKFQEVELQISRGCIWVGLTGQF